METLAEAMDRVKGTTDLKAFCDAHLQARPGDGRNFYACPACKSGHRRGGTAAFHIVDDDPTHAKCHSCGWYGDVFDLAGILNGTTDRAEQCDLVAEWAGTEGWDGGADGTADTRRKLGGTVDRGEAIPWDGEAGTKDAPGGTEDPADHAKGATDYTAFYAQAHADLMASAEALAYLHGRGITNETMERFNLGYVASWTHPATSGRYRTKRIIMPRTATTYTARAFDETERDYDPKFKKQVVGTQTDLFNLKAASGAEVVVVVEGELDAASIAQETGYVAVGLGSISNVGTFAERAKEASAGATWLISLDNDKPKVDGSNPGQDAQARLMEGMAAAGLACLAIDGAELYGEHKDANEVLCAEPGRLKAALDGIVARNAERARRERMGRYSIVDPAEAVRALYDLKEGRAPISSGLAMLDNLTGGGLHAKSLHIIGAQSSEGKTTITLQVADHVARSGHPVLFVTIEQRSSELIAKSLSRIAYARSRGTRTLTARAITNPKEREEWTAGEWRTLTDACNEYADQVAPNLLFMDPDEPPTVGAIWEAALLMAQERGEAPVVFVDYLQILAPGKGHERDSEKQVTDRNVTLLRRMAGGLNTPVWVVASLNRMSYTAPISTESYKESGAIEYGADVLMGLEPFDLETRWHNAADKKKAITAKALHDKTRRATRRWMDLKVMKNRFGSLPDYGLPFVYHADADTFETMWKVNREKRSEDDGVSLGEPMGWDDDGDDGGLVM